MSHLKTIVRPASELHLAVLVVKREPRDVDQAGGLKKKTSHCHKMSQRGTYLEYSWGDIRAVAFIGDHHICRIRPVKLLVRAATVENCQMSASLDLVRPADLCL